MNRREARRVNPIAHVTAFAVTVLIVFEITVIAGILELEAQTVAKYTPWAYEPFLRLVGEHPESAQRWAAIEEPGENDDAGSAVAAAAGLELSAIPLLTGTNGTAASANPVPDADLESEVVPEAQPETSPDVTPKTAPEEVEPVG